MKWTWSCAVRGVCSKSLTCRQWFHHKPLTRLPVATHAHSLTPTSTYIIYEIISLSRTHGSGSFSRKSAGILEAIYGVIINNLIIAPVSCNKALLFFWGYLADFQGLLHSSLSNFEVYLLFSMWKHDIKYSHLCNCFVHFLEVIQTANIPINYYCFNWQETALYVSWRHLGYISYYVWTYFVTSLLHNSWL